MNPRVNPEGKPSLLAARCGGIVLAAIGLVQLALLAGRWVDDPGSIAWLSLHEASVASSLVNAVLGTSLLVRPVVMLQWLAVLLLTGYLIVSASGMFLDAGTCGCVPGIAVPPWVSALVAASLLGTMLASLAVAAAPSQPAAVEATVSVL